MTVEEVLIDLLARLRTWESTEQGNLEADTTAVKSVYQANDSLKELLK